MIDTIRLNLADTIITDNSDILIQPGEIDFKTGLQSENDLFITNTGTRVRGRRAFINNDFFNLTIYPKQEVFSEQIKNKQVEYIDRQSWSPEHKYLKYTLNKTFDYNSKIFLQTSLPKINSYLKGTDTYNLNSLNEDDIKLTIRFLSNTLKDYGILTDFDESNLSRIDLFNNVNTVLPFQDYGDIFKHLNLSKKNLAEFAGETFLFKNKSSQFIIYDKSKELLIKHKINLPGNYTRFENRFLNKRKILNSFGGNHIRNLLQTDLLKNEMIKAGNNIFNFKKIELEIVDENYLYGHLNSLKENNRYWLNKFFYSEGLYNILTRIPKSQLLYVLKDLLSRDKYNRVKKQINNFNFNMSVFSNSKLSNLYDEIKNKYFSNLAAA